MIRTCGGLDPCGQLQGELLGDLLGVAAQRQGVLVVCVIGVLDGDVPDCRLGLGGDELQEVVDLEERLGGVLDLPDHDRGQLDRVAVGVVDLEDGGLVVAHPGGDLPGAGERVHPAQPVGADGADVPSEELDDPGLAGRDHLHAGHAEEGAEEQQDAG